MTKRTTRKPAIDMTRMSDSHRQQIERVFEIGAKIGLDQEKQKREILKAIMQNFDAMIDAVDEGTRRTVFAALVEVANVSDAKRIRQHQRFEGGEGAASVPPVGQQGKAQGQLRNEQQ